MRAYHHVYRSDYSPWNIADFLILNRRFPRSVAFSYAKISHCLDLLAEMYGEEHPCHVTARELVADFKRLQMGEIFQDGLTEFVHGAIRRTERLGREIYAAYHF